MTIESLQQQLSVASNPQVKQWFESYMKYSLPFRGLKLPLVRSIVLAWVKAENFSDKSPAEQLDTALTLIRKPWGEDKLAGIPLIQEVLIKNNMIDWEAELPEFAALFDGGYIQDWSTCDWFCIRVFKPLIEKHGKRCAVAVMAWCHANNLWRKRVSVVSFVNIAKHGDRNFTDFSTNLLTICEIVVQSPERFAQTGTGWALRELKRHQRKIIATFDAKLKLGMIAMCCTPMPQRSVHGSSLSFYLILQLLLIARQKVATTWDRSYPKKSKLDSAVRTHLLTATKWQTLACGGYMTTITWLFVLKFCAALGCGLMAGVFFAFSTVVMNALARLQTPQGIAFMQSINIAVINPSFMAVFLGTAAVSIFLAIHSLCRWQEPSSTYLLIGSLLYLIGTFGITLAFNVPLNESVAKVEPHNIDGENLWVGYSDQLDNLEPCTSSSSACSNGSFHDRTPSGRCDLMAKVSVLVAKPSRLATKNYPQW